ncbi:hypothetical protein CHLRE_17g745197v5 [Chlamydomonas reinhardtii]|uniref:Uncharacterized protein n=1 Tax=Chlamydomonas reinhardtii TaxID=3055 RepID=A0A2K3CS09_CHLRE|nr:uncharacterized protein CHLRE_17g745197v5 [Chlamydomonas reinhardtii]PNW71067.1 hypothetical protein CHLRE_17g745197v5 [Chlamydomonas reinhardtii]
MYAVSVCHSLGTAVAVEVADGAAEDSGALLRAVAEPAGVRAGRGGSSSGALGTVSLPLLASLDIPSSLLRPAAEAACAALPSEATAPASPLPAGPCCRCSLPGLDRLTNLCHLTVVTVVRGGSGARRGSSSGIISGSGSSATGSSGEGGGGGGIGSLPPLPYELQHLPYYAGRDEGAGVAGDGSEVVARSRCREGRGTGGGQRIGILEVQVSWYEMAGGGGLERVLRPAAVALLELWASWKSEQLMRRLMADVGGLRPQRLKEMHEEGGDGESGRWCQTTAFSELY